MPLAAKLSVLQFKRRFQFHTIGKGNPPAIGDIGRIDLADRIVAVTNGKLDGSLSHRTVYRRTW